MYTDSLGYIYVFTGCLKIMLFLNNIDLVNSWLLTDYTYCKFYECCNNEYVPYSIFALEAKMNALIGQPFSRDLISILDGHKKEIYSTNYGSDKALVISMHGWPGVGKNFVATMIAESLFKLGMNSKYVKLINGERDFKGDLKTSKIKLMDEIKDIVSQCDKSLFIFDEMDKMPAGIIDIISANMDFHRSVGKVNYRNAIFIFISNMAGTLIADQLLKLYDSGLTRNQLTFDQFEPIIRQTAFNEGGFQGSVVLANHLIDHYVPFLPLEQQHIEECTIREFWNRGANPSEEMISKATSVITYGPAHRPIFANNGCKRIHKQVIYVLHARNREL